MDKAAEAKVLLVGNVDGNFAQLFKRVETVSKKAGPFRCMFCVGKFFGEGGAGELQPYLSGGAKIPLPTYFVDGMPQGREVLKNVGADGIVCPNLVFLRGGGLQELQGLSVAYLAGRYDSISYKDKSALAATAAIENGEYRSTDVTAVLKAITDHGKVPVDFLLTSEWGRGVLNAVSSPPQQVDASEAGSPIVADLVKEVAPRYHVAGTEGVFFARDPYKNERGNVTRFIALGAVGNAQKEKWMHALGVQPAVSMPPPQLYSVPPGSSVSPYSVQAIQAAAAAAKRPFEGVDEGGPEGQYWRFQEKKQRRDPVPLRGKPANLEGDAAFRVFVRNLPFRCTDEDITAFFSECGPVEGVRVAVNEEGRPRGYGHVQLASAEAVERALALDGQQLMGRDLQILPPDMKPSRGPPPPGPPPGGVVDGCWFCLSNEAADTSLVVAVGEHVYVALEKGPVVPAHVQLVPIEHQPNTLLLPPAAADEYTRYVEALRSCFQQKLGQELLLFERYMGMRARGGNHCFVGALPVSVAVAQSARQVFQEHCDRAGFEFEVLPPAPTWEMQRHEMHEKLGHREYLAVTLPDGSVLLHQIGKGHPMNFAREVIAHMVGRPDRAEWKKCGLSPEETEAAVAKFTAMFSPFNL